MTIADAKAKMLELVSTYFGDGHVFFAGAKMARSVEPYVTLQITGFSKGSSDIRTVNETDEYTRSFSMITANCQIDLYTKGRNLALAGEYEEFDNTALEDVEDFDQYIDSDFSLELQSQLGMSVIRDGDIQDTSALVNDSTYQYRATVKYNVEFWDGSFGYKGQNDKDLPNSSHGGSMDMEYSPMVIEDVDVTWRNKNE